MKAKEIYKGYAIAKTTDGKGREIIEKGLTLEQAQLAIFEYYTECYKDERGYAANWGMAVIRDRARVNGASKTFSDGTRQFTYDNQKYKIIDLQLEEELYS